MPGKKIIEKKDVKENNPNDDEEILKNNEDADRVLIKDDGESRSNNDNEKQQGSETIGIP